MLHSLDDMHKWMTLVRLKVSNQVHKKTMSGELSKTALFRNICIITTRTGKEVRGIDPLILLYTVLPTHPLQQPTLAFTPEHMMSPHDTRTQRLAIIYTFVANEAAKTHFSS